MPIRNRLSIFGADLDPAKDYKRTNINGTLWGRLTKNVGELDVNYYAFVKLYPFINKNKFGSRDLWVVKTGPIIFR